MYAFTDRQTLFGKFQEAFKGLTNTDFKFWRKEGLQNYHTTAEQAKQGLSCCPDDPPEHKDINGNTVKEIASIDFDLLQDDSEDDLQNSVDSPIITKDEISDDFGDNDESDDDKFVPTI